MRKRQSKDCLFCKRTKTMKMLKIVLGVLLLLFVVFQIFVFYSRKNIENYSYKVIKEYDSFEIRQYDAALFTSVKLPMKDYKKSSSRGFSILAGYIFGGNEKEEKIAMTSPVSMSIEDSTTMMFMVPRSMKKENLPQPKNKEIEFREVPKLKLAAIRFGGWATNDKIEQNKQKLIKLLEKEGIEFTDRFSFFGYNPPFDLFFRRNEVVVELKD